jgi:hypothetical protein
MICEARCYVFVFKMGKRGACMGCSVGIWRLACGGTEGGVRGVMLDMCKRFVVWSADLGGNTILGQ